MTSAGTVPGSIARTKSSSVGPHIVTELLNYACVWHQGRTCSCSVAATSLVPEVLIKAQARYRSLDRTNEWW